MGILASIDSRYSIALETIVWSLLNPICIISSFFACNYIGLYQTVETNTIALNPVFFPVYLLFGIIALVFQIIIAVIIGLIRSSNVSTCITSFFIAQRPFVVMILFSNLLIMGGIEGNIIGFIIVPLFAICSLISSAFACGKYFKEVSKDNNITSGNTQIRPYWQIGTIFLVVLIISGLVVKFQGPRSLLGEQMGWSPDTPQFAVEMTLKATKNKDPDLFARYVDIDSVLENLKAQGGLEVTKEELLNSLLRGELLTDSNSGFKYGRWIVQQRQQETGIGAFNHQTIVGPFLLVQKKSTKKTSSDTVYLAIAEVKATNPQDNDQVDFTLRKTDGYYRIVGLDSSTLRNQQYSRRRLALVISQSDEIKARSKKTIDCTVHIDDKTFNSEVTVTNKTTQLIRGMDFFVLLKDINTLEVSRDNISVDYPFKNYLQPGETRTVSIAYPRTNNKLTSGKFAIVDILPEGLVFDSGTGLDFLENKNY